VFDAPTEGRRALLIVDERKTCGARSKYGCCRISRSERGPFQSFLVGSTIPQDHHQSDLEQLRQRVIAPYHLGPMNGQTGNYAPPLNRSAGPATLAADERVGAIHQHASGIPRRIHLGQSPDDPRLSRRVACFSADDVNRVAADLPNRRTMDAPPGRPRTERPAGKQA
jgi:hypothetical protein